MRPSENAISLPTGTSSVISTSPSALVTLPFVNNNSSTLINESHHDSSLRNTILLPSSQNNSSLNSNEQSILTFSSLSTSADQFVAQLNIPSLILPSGSVPTIDNALVDPSDNTNFNSILRTPLSSFETRDLQNGNNETFMDLLNLLNEEQNDSNTSFSRITNTTDQTDATTSFIIDSIPAAPNARPTALQGLEHLSNDEDHSNLNENIESISDISNLLDNRNYESDYTNSNSTTDEPHTVLINRGQQLTRKKRTRRLEALAELESNANLRITYRIFIKYLESQIVSFSLASRLHSLQVNEIITLSALLKSITSKNRPEREILLQMINELSDTNLFNIDQSKPNRIQISKRSFE